MNKLVSLKSLIREATLKSVHDSTRGHTYVLGENVYQHGTISFKLKLESFQNSDWILVGIVKADVVPKGPNSFFWTGAYGCHLGIIVMQLYEDGVLTGSGRFCLLEKNVETG